MTDIALRQYSDEEERHRLGDRLREARKYLGLKQEEVANYLKIPRTALTDIENGQRRVEVIELTRLAKLYRQPVAFFTGEDEASATLPVDVAHLARRAAESGKGSSDRHHTRAGDFITHAERQLLQ